MKLNDYNNLELAVRQIGRDLELIKEKLKKLDDKIDQHIYGVLGHNG